MGNRLLLMVSILCTALCNVSCNGNKAERRTETTLTQETIQANMDTSVMVKSEADISTTAKSATDTLSTVNSLKTEKKTSLTDTTSVAATKVVILSSVPAFSNEDVTEGLNEIRSLMEGATSAAQNKDTAKMKEYETKIKSISTFSMMSWAMKLKSDETEKLTSYLEILEKEASEATSKIKAERGKK